MGNPEQLEEAQKRAVICSQCPLNKNNTCSKNLKGKAVTTFVYNGEPREQGKEYAGCGCYLPAKTRSTNSVCPLGKW